MQGAISMCKIEQTSLSAKKGLIYEIESNKVSGICEATVQTESGNGEIALEIKVESSETALDVETCSFDTPSDKDIDEIALDRKESGQGVVAFNSMGGSCETTIGREMLDDSGAVDSVALHATANGDNQEIRQPAASPMQVPSTFEIAAHSACVVFNVIARASHALCYDEDTYDIYRLHLSWMSPALD